MIPATPTDTSDVEESDSITPGSISESPARNYTDKLAKAPQKEPNQRSLLGRIYHYTFGNAFRFIFWMVESLFGLASVVLLLAIVAAIPLLNVLALGALLSGEGAVARTGKFSRSVPLFGPAARLGRMLFGILLFLLPLSYLGSFAADAVIIDPNSPATRGLRLATLLIAGLVFVHLLLAIARGGHLRNFFSPRKNLFYVINQLKTQSFLKSATGETLEFIRKLEIARHFRLGLLGAVGVLAWTFIPTTLYAVADSSDGPAVLVTIVGGVLLALVLSWLPMLQAAFAAEARFGCFKQVQHARQLFRRTPFLWTLTMLLGYGMSLILYLFKVVAPPSDALWLLTIVFISIIYPARILAGWVYWWASSREKLPWIGWRWLWSLTSLALCGFYVFLLFFTRNIGANGKLVLYEQPFLLIPSPF